MYRLGYLCFGCNKPVNAIVNKYWCEKCLTHGYYSGK